MNDSVRRRATVAICGDAGSLGAAVAARLVATGTSVFGCGPGAAPKAWPEEAPYETVFHVGAELEHRLASVRPLAVAAFPWNPSGRLRASRTVDAERAVVEGAIDAGAQRVVCWSDTRVYSSPQPGRGPFPESSRPTPPPPPESPANSWAAYEARLAQPLARHSKIAFIVLRAAPVVGSDASSPLRELAATRLVPRVAGCDPPLQFLHFDDAVEVLRRALGQAFPGVYNVAGDGVILYSELCRALDGVPLRLSGGSWNVLSKLGRWSRLYRLPIEAFEMASRHVVADNMRLKTHFGYRPGHSARATVRQYLAGRRGEVAER